MPLSDALLCELVHGHQPKVGRAAKGMLHGPPLHLLVLLLRDRSRCRVVGCCHRGQHWLLRCPAAFYGCSNVHRAARPREHDAGLATWDDATDDGRAAHAHPGGARATRLHAPIVHQVQAAGLCARQHDASHVLPATRFLRRCGAQRQGYSWAWLAAASSELKGERAWTLQQHLRGVASARPPPGIVWPCVSASATRRVRLACVQQHALMPGRLG
mmetsp:Transcript_89433/g.208255  ORF Transcript_89433/g.208255 Transcript_89433/m.208255 type:complete len:215 (+) Transcript_89433:542-1186(+)